MGLRSPSGYVGYTCDFLETFIDLLDTYCAGCHTCGNFKNGCKDCPMGQLILHAKDYIINTHVVTAHSGMMKHIRAEIKPIFPSPHFNASFTRKALAGDKLHKLRGLLGDYRGLLAHEHRGYNLSQKAEKRTWDRVQVEIEKEDRLAVLNSI